MVLLYRVESDEKLCTGRGVRGEMDGTGNDVMTA